MLSYVCLRSLTAVFGAEGGERCAARSCPTVPSVPYPFCICCEFQPAIDLQGGDVRSKKLCLFVRLFVFVSAWATLKSMGRACLKSYRACLSEGSALPDQFLVWSPRFEDFGSANHS